MTDIEIKIDDLQGPAIAGLLSRHLEHMHNITPAGSVYALDLDALRVPEVTFWSAWKKDQIVGCVALKERSDELGEIKSLHTISEMRGSGVARKLVRQLIDNAQSKGLRRLSLETGNTSHFTPAQRLYLSFGFVQCAPFADYASDPHSHFMTLDLF